MPFARAPRWFRSYKKYPPLVVVAKGAYVDSIKASSCGALGDDYEAKNQLHLLLLHPSMVARWRA